MNLLAAGREDEEFLLDLLNTTPVVDGEPSDVLAQPKARAWMRKHSIATTDAELADLLFAFTVCKHVKSNAIVYAKDGATVGIGSGQPNRVDSARIAAWKSEEAAKAAGLPQRLTEDSVVASDAFFPFADGLEAAASAGATAVIQPGGSIRDAEVIARYEQEALPLVERFRPSLMMVSAGFDADERDPLAGLRMTSAGFRSLTGMLVSAADRFCGGRMVLVTEGGYDLAALEEGLQAVIDTAK